MESIETLIRARRRRTPRWAPGVVLSLALHAGLAAAAVLVPAFGNGERIPQHFVSVRIIAGQPAAASLTAKPRTTAGRSEPSPEPVAAPSEPHRMTLPIATPSPSAPRAKPAPSPTVPSAAKPVAADTGRPDAAEIPGASALVVSGPGGGAASISGLDNPDFQYAYYVERMLSQIAANWFRPSSAQEVQSVIFFRIRRSGHLTDIEIEESSNVPSFDRAAFRAIVGASPLPPLPYEFTSESLGVHLKFH